MRCKYNSFLEVVVGGLTVGGLTVGAEGEDGGLWKSSARGAFTSCTRRHGSANHFRGDLCVDAVDRCRSMTFSTKLDLKTLSLPQVSQTYTTSVREKLLRRIVGGICRLKVDKLTSSPDRCLSTSTKWLQLSLFYVLTPG